MQTPCGLYHSCRRPIFARAISHLRRPEATRVRIGTTTGVVWCLLAGDAWPGCADGFGTPTVLGHQCRLRFFLRFLKFDRHSAALRKLRMDQIDGFLRQMAKTNNRFSLQHVVASLRSFLRYYHARGVIKEPLHQQIDTPRTYRLEQLPKALPWEKVVALLRSIDRSDASGLRDFTILYLAARYGLRSGELVRLTLDHV